MLLVLRDFYHAPIMETSMTSIDVLSLIQSYADRFRAVFARPIQYASQDYIQFEAYVKIFLSAYGINLLRQSEDKKYRRAKAVYIEGTHDVTV